MEEPEADLIALRPLPGQEGRPKIQSMLILAASQVGALRFMESEPLRVDPFSSVKNVEEVAAMLDHLAKMGLCRRTLQGLNRVYSITPAGLEALAEAERTQTKLSAA